MNRFLKSMIAASLLSAWMTLPSCTPKFDSEQYLQQEVSSLQLRTLPPDSRLVNQHLPTRQSLGASTSWEFDSNYTSDAYNRWVTSRLRPDFQVRETAGSPLHFSKYAHGDEETISVETTTSSGTLHVALNLEIYPD